MAEYKPGDRVIITLRTHIVRGGAEKPNVEIEGSFIRMQGERSAIVKINTPAEGEQVRSFLLNRLRPVV